jgi:hypothetical protein
MGMAYCRMMHAGHFRQPGIESQIVDLLRICVPRTVFAPHYFTPSFDYKVKVLDALDRLRREIDQRL